MFIMLTLSTSKDGTEPSVKERPCHCVMVAGARQLSPRCSDMNSRAFSSLAPADWGTMGRLWSGLHPSGASCSCLVPPCPLSTQESPSPQALSVGLGSLCHWRNHSERLLSFFHFLLSLKEGVPCAFSKCLLRRFYVPDTGCWTVEIRE